MNGRAEAKTLCWTYAFDNCTKAILASRLHRSFSHEKWKHAHGIRSVALSQSTSRSRQDAHRQEIAKAISHYFGHQTCVQIVLMDLSKLGVRQGSEVCLSRHQSQEPETRFETLTWIKSKVTDPFEFTMYDGSSTPEKSAWPPPASTSRTEAASIPAGTGTGTFPPSSVGLVKI